MNIILERVYKVCKTVQEEIPEITTFKKLMARTRKLFKDHNFDIDLKSKKDKNLDNDKWYVMAYYDSDNDAHGDTPVEVIVNHNLDGTEEFGTRQVTLFLMEIFDAVTHEYRHQYQSMRRDHQTYSPHAPVSGSYGEYLADYDELDAYAFSISIELLRIMPVYRAKRNLSRISILSKMRTGPVYSSPTLRAYIESFGLNPLTKKLAKKIYLYLDTLDSRFIFM
jgi:hypothetical protein